MSISPRQSDINLINEIISTSKVFIDTCSLMDRYYANFEKILFPIVRSLNSYIIIPQRVIDELKKFSNDINDIRYSAANYAINSIKKNKELIKRKGEDGDDFADSVFSCQFTKFRLKYNLTLITQDVGLAHDILRLNESVSQRSQYIIKVYRITKYGTLGHNDGDIERRNNSSLKRGLS